MKKLSIYSLLLFLSVFAVSCVDGDFDRPPIKEPLATWQPTHTIEELLERYQGDCDSVSDSVILEVVVVGNDVSGNLYKKFIVQDRTGGLDIEVDMRDIYKIMHVGQKLMINCTGMFIGRYNGLPQLGFKSWNDRYGWQIGRMTEKMLEKIYQKNGFPSLLNLPEIPEMTIAEYKAAGMTYVNTLVRIKDVYFYETNIPFAEAGGTTNRYFADASGEMILRTSNYSSFASKMLPDGLGSLTGVLGIFGSDYQLFLRDENDIKFE